MHCMSFRISEGGEEMQLGRGYGSESCYNSMWIEDRLPQERQGRGLGLVTSQGQAEWPGGDHFIWQSVAVWDRGKRGS